MSAYRHLPKPNFVIYYKIGFSKSLEVLAFNGTKRIFIGTGKSDLLFVDSWNVGSSYWCEHPIF